MPIRMVEDEPGKNKSSNRRRSSRNSSRPYSNNSGLNKGLGNILGVLLPYLIKKPKILILVIVLGLLYFFFGRSCTSNAMSEGGISNFVRGGELDKDIYEETEIFEALADNKKNPLPEQVSLVE